MNLGYFYAMEPCGLGKLLLWDVKVGKLSKPFKLYGGDNKHAKMIIWPLMKCYGVYVRLSVKNAATLLPNPWIPPTVLNGRHQLSLYKYLKQSRAI